MLNADHIGERIMRAVVNVMHAGREKTKVDSQYVQLNPLTAMTHDLFRDAIAERQDFRDAKDYFRSQSIAQRRRRLKK